MRPTEAGTGSDQAATGTTVPVAASEPDAEPTAIAADEYVARSSKAMEIIVAAVALLFNVLFLIAAQSIELRREAGPGQIDARFWPSVLATIGILLAAPRLIITLIRPADERDDLEIRSPGQSGKLLLTLALTAGYLGVWSFKTATLHLFGLVIGFKLFVIATPVYLAALLWVFGARRWKTLVIFPVVTTAFIYLLFGQLLRIAL
jgi:hypothetical protein